MVSRERRLQLVDLDGVIVPSGTLSFRQFVLAARLRSSLRFTATPMSALIRVGGTAPG